MKPGKLGAAVSDARRDERLLAVGSDERETFEHAHDMAKTELIFGLVCPLGTDIEKISRHLQLSLDALDYTATEIRLSELLSEFDWDEPLSDKLQLDSYISSHMDAGRRLRREWKRDDALGLLGVAAVVSEREDLLRNKAPTNRRAWILRQLKTPGEVEALRNVYGSRFFLIAAYAPEDERAQWLDNAIAESRGTANRSKWDVTPDILLKRDQSETGLFGQNVRDTFHRADLFIDASKESELDSQIERLLEIVLANPFRSPTRAEMALFEADGAAKASAEPGRQVGAAIVTEQGDIVALGANEVPRPGGGVYTDDSDDPGIPDQREFRFGETPEDREIDTNDRIQRDIAAEIGQALEARNWLRDAVSPDELLSAILTTRLGDLTEFGRAMHAEMSAILDAARNGRAVSGCSLYVTTFPCHNCARHIIGAGIRKCIFLAPYAKSQAEILHRDALVVGKIGPGGKKVAFEPFVGVAPRRYVEFFSWSRRKDDQTGKLLQWDPKTARPRFSDEDPSELRQHQPAYRVREDLVMFLLSELQEDTGLTVRGDKVQPDSGSTDQGIVEDRKDAGQNDRVIATQKTNDKQDIK